MPVFGLGTYMMGEGANDRQEVLAIRLAIEAGITLIDTAEKYAGGHCEELVGQAIKNYDRKKLFIVSKVGGNNLSYSGIKTAIVKSLERLDTPYLNLYLMHRCPLEDKFAECVKAMDELMSQGLVKNIGLSNTNTKHANILQSLSHNKFVVNQVHYNLQFREPEQDGLVDYCQNNDMFLMAWRPVNKGALNKSGTDITKSGIAILDRICAKYQKTPAQIAISWLISQSNIVTLSKTAKMAHLKENLGAVGWQMEKSDVELLRKQFPNQQDISDTVPLE